MQPVIRVENLSKEYQLGTVSHGTLTHDLQSWWARLRGKEDPNSLLSHSPPLSSQPSSLNPHFLALNNVSFDVQQGDAVGIIGRNGAGKSTLLKILSQVTSPSAGTVKIKGRVASLLEVGTGFHPELTGRENVFLNGAILGMSKAEIQRKFDEIVAFAEIEKFIDTPVKRYSSGMYVRLAFAVAAHLDPEILIVDEVLAVGDAQFQKKCLGKMQDVGKEGRTVLFVSHQMEAICNLCSRAILLQDGEIKIDGNTRKVVDCYLQSGLNLAQKTLRERRDRSGDGRLRFTDTWVEDSQGRRGTPVLSGDVLTIVAEYEVIGEEKTSHHLVAFAVSDKNGYQFTDLSNATTGEIFNPTSTGKVRVRCTIQKLPLNAGKYNYNVILRSALGIEDFILNAGYFDVDAGNFFSSGKIVDKNQGLFLIEQKWSATEC